MKRKNQDRKLKFYSDIWFPAFSYGIYIYQLCISLAIANAQIAAVAPIKATRTAPHQGFTPVILLLKNPNIKRQQSVITAEIFKPVVPS